MVGPVSRAGNSVRFFWHLYANLKNWLPVWWAYRRRRPVPPLQFRRGFVLHHGEGDDPFLLLDEVFVGANYVKLFGLPIRGTIVDVGANIGATVLDFADHFPAASIHAYEPNPACLQTLRANVTANRLQDRVHLHGEAVGRCRGSFSLWRQKRSVLSAGYGADREQASTDELIVPMIGLDDIVAELTPPIALLKIDAEGAEADILEGASPATLEAIEQVVLEYHNHLVENALTRCEAALARAGFQTRILQSAGACGILHAWRA